MDSSFRWNDAPSAHFLDASFRWHDAPSAHFRIIGQNLKVRPPSPARAAQDGDTLRHLFQTFKLSNFQTFKLT